MPTEKKYYQCHLRQGDKEQVAWIEERGAKLTAKVELLPSKELWEVVEVNGPAFPERMLKEHQLMHRGSLPSVEAIGR
jgi:hypothetical protein